MSEAIIRDKTEYHARTIEEMERRSSLSGDMRSTPEVEKAPLELTAPVEGDAGERQRACAVDNERSAVDPAPNGVEGQTSTTSLLTREDLTLCRGESGQATIRVRQPRRVPRNTRIG